MLCSLKGSHQLMDRMKVTFKICFALPYTLAQVNEIQNLNVAVFSSSVLKETIQNYKLKKTIGSLSLRKSKRVFLKVLAEISIVHPRKEVGLAGAEEGLKRLARRKIKAEEEIN
ncbi:hypothetical protein RUM43_001193 [Polyplax serrata]|uniref:Uncharacterized protein n=1 Tax=Polyplax serrata TaxID=468196 RepID=A0AAN8SHB2_POLSC